MQWQCNSSALSQTLGLAATGSSVLVSLLVLSLPDREQRTDPSKAVAETPRGATSSRRSPGNPSKPGIPSYRDAGGDERGVIGCPNIMNSLDRKSTRLNSS